MLVSLDSSTHAHKKCEHLTFPLFFSQFWSVVYRSLRRAFWQEALPHRVWRNLHCRKRDTVDRGTWQQSDCWAARSVFQSVLRSERPVADTSLHILHRLTYSLVLGSWRWCRQRPRSFLCFRIDTTGHTWALHGHDTACE